MNRIRWGNVFLALLMMPLLVYGGTVLLGVAWPSKVSAMGVVHALGGVLNAQSRPETPAPAARTTEGPEQGGGIRSEVPVPESQGRFPLGTLTIAFDKEFPPYAPVVLLYQQKLAEKRGLGVHFVPFDVEDHNRFSEERRAELLQNGGIDVLLTTMNSYALWGGPEVGKITTLVGESAGADKAVVQASSIQTFNDLAGKAFAYSDGSVSEYLLYYMLRVGGVQANQVLRFGQENLNQASRRFVKRETHGVVGWTSSDLDAALKRPDSKVLMTSEQFRVTTDVVVSGKKALTTKKVALQAFHDAWFEAIKEVFERPDEAARAMAAWNGNWTGVNSSVDLHDALSEFAQATLADNASVLSDQNLRLLTGRYKEAQAVWLSGGRGVRRLLGDDELASVVEPAFVRKATGDPSLISSRPPVNPTFHLTAQPQVQGLSPEQQRRLNTVAVLGVTEVQFQPGSTVLSAAGRQDIETFVIPVLANTVGTYLKIEGSAGWPAGSNLDEAAVNALALEHARAVQDYVIKFGVPLGRLVVGTALPRCRECSDAAQAQRDNRVVFSLATAIDGR